jgi:hypothetical protein
VCKLISDGATIILRPYQAVVVMSRDKPKDTKEWTVQLLLHIGQPGMAKEIEEWDVPKFPINGHMIKEHAKDISTSKLQFYGHIIHCFVIRWKATWNARTRIESDVDRERF